MKPTPPPNLHAVQSSNLSRIGWYGPESGNPFQTELWIYFRAKGRRPGERLYVYYFVPMDVYQSLDSAPSKGRYFRSFIKARYPFDRG